MKTNHVLRLALLPLIGSLSHAVLAAAITEIDLTGSVTPTYLANEMKISEGKVAKFNIKIPVPDNRCVSSSTSTGKCPASGAVPSGDSKVAPMEVRITLTGGVSFKTMGAGGTVADPTKFTCDMTWGTTTRLAEPAATTLKGADGDTQATFYLNSGDMTNAFCTAQLSVQLMSGKKDFGVIVSAYHNYELEPYTNTTTAPSIVSFQQAAKIVVSEKEATVDVRPPASSKQFTTTNGNTAIAALGTIYYGDSIAAKYIDGSNDIADVAGNNILAKAKLTLSGLPLDKGVASIFLVSGTDCAVDGNKFASGTTSSGQITFTIGNNDSDGTVAPDQNVLSKGVTICYKSDGVDTINKGTVQHIIELDTAGTDMEPNLARSDGKSTLGSVIKNGASIKVLNLPHNGAGGDEFFLRIYNMNPNSSAKVYATLYGQDGVQKGNASVEVASLGSREVKVLKLGEVTKAFGLPDVDPWVGRAWMQLESDVQELRIQALVRSNGAGGILMNMSDTVADDKFR